MSSIKHDEYTSSDLITFITQDGKIYSFLSFLKTRLLTLDDMFHGVHSRESRNREIPVDVTTIGFQGLLNFLIKGKFPRTVVEWAETLFSADYFYLQEELAAELIRQAVIKFDDFYDLKMGKVLSPYYAGPLNERSSLKIVANEYQGLAYDPEFF